MEENIKLRIGTVLTDNGIDILSEDGRDLLHDLYRVIQQELDKAREEGIQKILDKMPQYVERNGREYYLDFYIKDISGERYYCSCYTNGDKKLTPEYDEEILLRSLVKTRDYLSKLKE